MHVEWPNHALQRTAAGRRTVGRVCEIPMSFTGIVIHASREPGRWSFCR